MNNARNKRPWTLRLTQAIHRRLKANGRSLEITKSGWLLIALTLMVGAVAINSGANLLHLVFGALVGVIIFSGIASERMLSRARVTRSLAGVCFAERSTPVHIELYNTHPHQPLLCVSVEVLNTEQDGSIVRQEPCLSLHVPPQASETLSTTLTAHQRGRQTAPKLVVATRYPWGFFLKKREIECPMELWVAPTPGQADRAEHGTRHGRANEAQRRARTGDPGEHKVYRPGDDPRRIDYKSSAKSTELLLRESLDQAADAASFELPAAEDPQVETKLRDICAASLACQAQGMTFSFVQEERTLLDEAQSLASPTRAFEILAAHAHHQGDLAA